MPSNKELEKLMGPDLWARTLVSLNKAFQLNTIVIEIDGQLMFPPIFSNSFCPLIGKDTASKTIYGCGNYNDAIQDVHSKGGPSITRCRSGFARFLMPIRSHGRMVGCVGGCGALIGSEELPMDKISIIAKEIGSDSSSLLAEAKASIPRLTSGVIDTYFSLLKNRVSARLD